MKIKLKKDHSVLGKVEKTDAVVEVREGVAQDLIDRGIAEKVTTSKSKAKQGK